MDVKKTGEGSGTDIAVVTDGWFCQLSNANSGLCIYTGGEQIKNVCYGHDLSCPE